MNIAELCHLQSMTKSKSDITNVIYKIVHLIYFRRADTKVVMSLRNIKDAFTSSYHHTKKMDGSITWPELYKTLMYSKYSEHVYSAYQSYFYDMIIMIPKSAFIEQYQTYSTGG